MMSRFCLFLAKARRNPISKASLAYSRSNQIEKAHRIPAPLARLGTALCKYKLGQVYGEGVRWPHPMIMSTKVGQTALQGKEEYIRGHIFDSVDYERTITGRGTLIMVIDPSDAKNTKAYRDIEQDTPFTVPANHEVKVIDGLVKVTK
ncbi:predicted protein [Histoplasma mississippiense (nom. inval.)]|uniref:predicted protein n=1 Tax=Ajellomyces capsulatus (strain NAm1 / WU24) TaxID=2059318 RepID=UPI000157BAB4|nr:predicted protein [Histoplasma mississippiense (nom. inval.)]EDN05676.1 predicted protein [Histoplasma mississippiense (nom. inval.)]